MRYRHSSINALPIAESDREFTGPSGAGRTTIRA